MEVEVGPHGHWLILFHKGYRDCFNSGEDVDIEVENNFDMNIWHCRFEIPLAFFPASKLRISFKMIEDGFRSNEIQCLRNSWR